MDKKNMAVNSTLTATQEETTSPAIIPLRPPVVKPTEKECATLKARLALLGRTLQCARRACDGRRTWHVSDYRGTFVFGHWGDVLAHVTSLEHRGRVL